MLQFCNSNVRQHTAAAIPDLGVTGLTNKSVHMSKSVRIGRDAQTGRFIPVKEAEKRPATTVVEKVKVGPTKHRNK